jgi:hypothetical protein
MNTTMLLAVDTARHEPGRHVTAAVETVRDLAAKTGDKVIVLHVHEYRRGVARRGISAEGEIKEADYGHIARGILAAGRQSR